MNEEIAAMVQARIDELLEDIRRQRVETVNEDTPWHARPHWFVSSVSGRTGCDVCGQPHEGHPEP